MDTGPDIPNNKRALALPQAMTEDWALVALVALEAPVVIPYAHTQCMRLGKTDKARRTLRSCPEACGAREQVYLGTPVPLL